MRDSVQRAVSADIEAIKQIEIECELSPWSVRDYTEEVSRSDSLFYVFKENGRILGFILARLITTSTNISQFSSELVDELETEIEIYNIAVDRNFRHRKIGSKLLAEILNRASLENAIRIHLEVRKTNSKAQLFYLKNGFEVTGERKNFYTNPAEDAVLMSFLR